MTRKVKVVLGLGVAVALIGAFLSPHFAVYRMRQAALAKDADTVSGYVDYPALKESLKAGFNARMMRAMQEQSNNPFAGLGMLLGAGLVNTMVDNMVTPQGLAAMMQGSSPRTPADEVPKGDGSKTSMNYVGMDKFVVTVEPSSGNGKPIKLIYLRHGLFSWKLSGVDLPL